MHTKNINHPADGLIPGYLKGELTTDEMRALIRWIEMSDSNKRCFDEYCEIWITTRASIKNPGYDFREGFRKFKQTIAANETMGPGIKTIHVFKRLSRYAALFIIAFSVSGFLFYTIGKNRANHQKQSFSELFVPIGSHARFSLPDGTTVTLNAGSRLQYDNRFGIKDRVVQLEGEGYFVVAKDKKRPFTVKTSDLNIVALGTIFNVKAYSEEKRIETTLVEGSVRIEEITAKNSAREIVLTPNQRLTFFMKDSALVEETSGSIERTENSTKLLQDQKTSTIPRIVTEDVDVIPVISWKENRWIFEKQSLAQIAIELERKFDVQINFESERLENFRFTGSIMAEPIEQVLEVLSIAAPINFKLKGRVVSLYENKDFAEQNKLLYTR